MALGDVGWRWVVLGGVGWRCVTLDGSGWRWMVLGGVGFALFALFALFTRFTLLSLCSLSTLSSLSLLSRSPRSPRPLVAILSLASLSSLSSIGIGYHRTWHGTGLGITGLDMGYSADFLKNGNKASLFNKYRPIWHTCPMRIWHTRGITFKPSLLWIIFWWRWRNNSW